jgi:hypothetical protein
MVDIDKTRADRDEERRSENKRQDTRRTMEKRMQSEPMKTFESKLSEKAAQEQDAKKTVSRHLHDLKKSKEEKQSMLDRILGVAKDKAQETEKSRVNATHKHAQKQEKEEVGKKVVKEDFKSKQAKESEKEEGTQKMEKKEGEQSAEGHKRVAEKSESEDGGGGGFGESSEGESGAGDQSLGNRNQSGSDSDGKNAFSTENLNQGKVGQQSSFSSGGFQQNAKSFSERDLDEIVSQVNIGMNERGEEEFTVELTDEYFEGLSIQATRTEEGVVVRFVCPNVGVRSTFLKYRPQVYQHLRNKHVNVYRIDIV